MSNIAEFAFINDARFAEPLRRAPVTPHAMNSAWQQ
jgi:hypothetical protein